MRVALWSIALCLAACGGSSDAPSGGPMPRPRGVSAVDPGTVDTPKPEAEPEPEPEDEATPLPESVPAAKEDEEKKDDKPPRDYPAELQAALGAPSDCLHARSGPNVPKELRIEVQAYFLESGFVSRAYARSAALDADEIACVTKRANAVRLAGPVEDAPRAVSTTLTLTLQPTASPVPEKPGPETAAPEANPQEAAPENAETP